MLDEMKKNLGIRAISEMPGIDYDGMISKENGTQMQMMPQNIVSSPILKVKNTIRQNYWNFNWGWTVLGRQKNDKMEITKFINTRIVEINKYEIIGNEDLDFFEFCIEIYKQDMFFTVVKDSVMIPAKSFDAKTLAMAFKKIPGLLTDPWFKDEKRFTEFLNDYVRAELQQLDCITQKIQYYQGYDEEGKIYYRNKEKLKEVSFIPQVKYFNDVGDETAISNSGKQLFESIRDTLGEDVAYNFHFVFFYVLLEKHLQKIGCSIKKPFSLIGRDSFDIYDVVKAHFPFGINEKIEADLKNYTNVLPMFRDTLGFVKIDKGIVKDKRFGDFFNVLSGKKNMDEEITRANFMIVADRVYDEIIDSLVIRVNKTVDKMPDIGNVRQLAVSYRESLLNYIENYDGEIAEDLLETYNQFANLGSEDESLGIQKEQRIVHAVCEFIKQFWNSNKIFVCNLEEMERRLMQWIKRNAFNAESDYFIECFASGVIELYRDHELLIKNKEKAKCDDIEKFMIFYDEKHFFIKYKNFINICKKIFINDEMSHLDVLAALAKNDLLVNRSEKHKMSYMRIAQQDVTMYKVYKDPEQFGEDFFNLFERD